MCRASFEWQKHVTVELLYLQVGVGSWSARPCWSFPEADIFTQLYLWPVTLILSADKSCRKVSDGISFHAAGFAVFMDCMREVGSVAKSTAR